MTLPYRPVMTSRGTLTWLSAQPRASTLFHRPRTTEYESGDQCEEIRGVTRQRIRLPILDSGSFISVSGKVLRLDIRASVQLSVLGEMIRSRAPERRFDSRSACARLPSQSHRCVDSASATASHIFREVWPLYLMLATIDTSELQMRPGWRKNLVRYRSAVPWQPKGPTADMRNTKPRAMYIG